MKKWYWVVIVIITLIIAWFFIRFISGNEDDWIKDERGVWIKHGNPANIPAEVFEQQEAIDCANNLYQQQNKSILSSQCLGTCQDYAVDIVHVPRSAEDNLIENQCSDYREGRVTQFIELDKEGNIVKIEE